MQRDNRMRNRAELGIRTEHIHKTYYTGQHVICIGYYMLSSVIRI